ncbi:hypothetical protein SAICODRAFT_20975 [Saitoella complicata NRRL Y-17804]|uniref:DNA repair protein Rad26 n=1 Tax=Saitoella complicata (strain BCRC 22490 / CBS 7301 / JCM 7358 / NBRC 10748 / NRRL Y-17804) TaxID=698492 RepID=A0A0E9NIU3_SAICN|nr:uncharacterized protein SAICODRAFT_20975 [Saitoella complicata NRRL Y-17804]ODQ51269.1 hypothetical protein SAICODRAFT_20975 [Saitoella complicata NRRL Y-17804]GAO49330.1 hypothetical protein G7K_3481-t1 [Saitoella complicata NRRL Y-17804]
MDDDEFAFDDDIDLDELQKVEDAAIVTLTQQPAARGRIEVPGTDLGSAAGYHLSYGQARVAQLRRDGSDLRRSTTGESMGQELGIGGAPPRRSTSDLSAIAPQQGVPPRWQQPRSYSSNLSTVGQVPSPAALPSPPPLPQLPTTTKTTNPIPTNPSDLVKELEALRAQNSSLQSSLATSTTLLSSHAGQISLLRSNLSRLSTSHSAALISAKQEVREAEESARRELESLKGELERERVEKGFLEREVREVGEMSKELRAKLAAGGASAETPRKKTNGDAGGWVGQREFEGNDDQIIRRKRRRTTSANQPHDAPVPETDESEAPIVVVPAVKAEEHDRLDFIHELIAYTPPFASSTSYIALSTCTLPKSSLPISTSLTHQILIDSSVLTAESLPKRVLEVLLDMANKIEQEQMWPALVHLFFLAEWTMICHPHIETLRETLEGWLAFTKRVIAQEMIPRIQSTDLDAETDPAEGALESVDAAWQVLETLLFVVGAAGSKEEDTIRKIWGTLGLEWTLMSLHPKQRSAVTSAALRTLHRSITPTSLGPLLPPSIDSNTSDETERAKERTYLFDALTKYLIRPQTSLTLKCLVIDVLARNHSLHSSTLQPRTEKMLIPRLIRCITSTVTFAYNRPSAPSPPLTTLLRSSVRLLRSIAPVDKPEQLLQEIVSAGTGTFQAFVVGMTRVAFDEWEGEEEGWGDDVAEFAREVLECGVSPEEGDQIYEVMYT